MIQQRDGASHTGTMSTRAARVTVADIHCEAGGVRLLDSPRSLEACKRQGFIPEELQFKCGTAP